MEGTVGGTGVQVILPDAPESALETAKSLRDTSERRVDVPVRKSFVRNDDEDERPPLSRLIGRGGRGGAVAVKLYLALIWRCSAPPYTTDVPARIWARLLGLDQPDTLGARRIAAALDVLHDEKLIDVTKRRGEPSLIKLLEESGTGAAYDIPSTAHQFASPSNKPKHVYFKIPSALWTDGHIQSMSASALAMLLVALAEQGKDKRKTWWSTTVFPARYNLTPTTRSKGTRELVGRRLLLVTKRSVPNSAKAQAFSRERVRNVYLLINEAYPHDADDRARAALAKKGAKKTTKRTVKKSPATRIVKRSHAKGTSAKSAEPVMGAKSAKASAARPRNPRSMT